MRVRIELTDWEIRNAIEKAIKAKFPELTFYNGDVKLEGSIKVKSKAVRKEMKRLKAYVETNV